MSTRQRNEVICLIYRNLQLLYQELRRFVLQDKAYSVNTVSGLIGEVIFIFGLLLGVFHQETAVTTEWLVKFGCWYVLTASISEAVMQLEDEVRANYLENLLTTKTSFAHIYSLRWLVYSVKNSLLISGLLLVFVSSTKLQVLSNLTIRDIFYSLSFFLVVYGLLFATSIALTLVYKRISVAISCFSNYWLFLGNVISSAGVFNYYSFNTALFTQQTVPLCCGIILLAGICYYFIKRSQRVLYYE